MTLLKYTKSSTNTDDIDMNLFFSFSENTQLKGHNLKLNKPKANNSMGKDTQEMPQSRSTALSRP